MCTTCGCGHSGPHMHEHVDADGHVTITVHDHDHDHHHEHDHSHAHDHHHHHPEHSHDAAMPTGRAISIEQDILARNDAVAAQNRMKFASLHALALNLVSSPGSGKTELLCATLARLKAEGTVSAMVIEGDQETANDADRIRATGARAIQINTGKGCHLDAEMVKRALEALPPEPESAVFIENVGNLVCPAEFDLGEAHKVAVLSVTEGDDKPLKYPDMFRASSLVIINKIDLLPYVRFDADKAEANVLRVNPKAKVLRVSATTGEGLEKWLAWIKAQLVLAGL